MSGYHSPQTTRALLVDDEAIALQRLRRALQAFPDIVIMGEATDGLTAVSLINHQQPDLVFLDIQMPGLNGFEVLRQLTGNPLIVFVTAYDAYAVKAFEANSIDYLLKPVEQQRLALTIQRVRDNRQGLQVMLGKLQLLLQQQQPRDFITTVPVKTGNKIQLIPVGDIVYLKADDKYVNLHTQEGAQLIEYPLNYLLERLPPEFIRIHRSYIINKMKIREIHKEGKAAFTIILRDAKGTSLRSAQSYYESIRTQLLIP